MAPKKVADKTIAAELTSVVDQIYNGPDRDKLSVNYARELVEAKLGLDEGFLKEGQWKARSKEIIRAALVTSQIPADNDEGITDLASAILGSA